MDRYKGTKSSDEISWSSIIHGVFSGLLNLIGDQARVLVKKQEEKMIKSIFQVSAFLIGALFVFNGIAIFINEYMNSGNWQGYILSGLSLMVVGLILQKSKEKN